MSEENSASTGTTRQDFISWAELHMGIAMLAQQRSKDPRYQVGACIVNSANKVVGVGYNGMPQGCSDKKMPWGKDDPDPLKTKYPYVCHAEANAIIFRSTENLEGCKMYVTRFPCQECAKLIIQSGIKEVFYTRVKKEEQASIIMFKEAKIDYKQYQPTGREIVIKV